MNDRCYCGMNYRCQNCIAAGGEHPDLVLSPKPGDTIDPRTLPVGAEFRDGPCGESYTVVFAGYCRLTNSKGSVADPIVSNRAILLSLPQPIADEVVELGTLAKGDHFQFAEPGCVKDVCLYIGDVEKPFREAKVGDAWHVHGKVWGRNSDGHHLQASPTSKVRRVPAPTPAKRPPCDACGEEAAKCLCAAHWKMSGNPDRLKELISARRAKQTYGSSFDVSSLPTYDQIAGWLGAEWVMTNGTTRDSVNITRWSNYGWPCPWFSQSGSFECSLLHTPSGQRVEVTAPRGSVNWRAWFTLIGKHERGDCDLARYRNHVRWLDPDTKTSGSAGPLKGTQADSVSQPEPEAQRWQTTDPARIAALEAKLAEQVASGGQDCAPARSLVERAERLKAEEFDRQLGYIQEVKSRHTKVKGIQAGPRLSRHELPSGQRLDRKLTGR